MFVRPATSADAAPIGDIHARNMRASLTMAGGKALDAAVLARISPSAFVPAWRHAISAPPDASPQVFAAVEDGVVEASRRSPPRSADRREARPPGAPRSWR